MIKTIAILLIAAAIFTPVAIAQENSQTAAESDIITITGTVQRYTFEGGFYGIEGDDGTVYKPTELDQGYQVEGMRVKIVARKIQGKLLTHGWGTPIEILSITHI